MLVEVASLAFGFLSLVFSIAFAFVVFHVVYFCLDRVNDFRVENSKKPFSSRLVFFLALACALSFVL